MQTFCYLCIGRRKQELNNDQRALSIHPYFESIKNRSRKYSFSTSESYCDGIEVTANSPQILAKLPNEIFDAVLSYLSRKDWLHLRQINSLFRHPAQSRIYRNIELYDYRSSEGDEIRPLERFFTIIKDQPHIIQYIIHVRMRSLLDPLAQVNIAKYLATLLKELRSLQSITLCFHLIREITARTQEQAMTTLRRGLESRKGHLPHLEIELDYLSPTILSGLNGLSIRRLTIPQDAVFSRIMVSDEQLNVWLSELAPCQHLRIIHLGALETTPATIEYLCVNFTQFTELQATFPTSTSCTDVAEALQPARDHLTKLSLHWSRVDPEKVFMNPKIMLKSLTALRYLEIDSTFLFMNITCDAERSEDGQCLAFSYSRSPEIEGQLPSNLQELLIRCNNLRTMIALNNMPKREPGVAEQYKRAYDGVQLYLKDTYAALNVEILEYYQTKVYANSVEGFRRIELQPRSNA